MSLEKNVQEINKKVAFLKSKSGSHSPSIDTFLQEIPEIKIDVDACFLSNPYATDLFLTYLKNDLIDTNKLRDVLEYYPPQNYAVAEYISKAIGTPAKNIFVTNGAIEAIQAVLHNFLAKKICVVIPTFSSYYEFIKPEQEVVYYPLTKENDFKIVVNDYIAFVEQHKPDTIVLINPNNPNGGYLSKQDIFDVVEKLSWVKNIIIDESFIHFAYEELMHKFENIIIIKSMSKDFGIAGIRAGYAIMNEKRVDQLLSNGYLWNVSGLANYFFKIYCQPEFIRQYNIVRKKYIMNTQMFLSQLAAIEKIKIYPSKANFALIELLEPGITSFDFCMNLLVNYGVYVRDCSDKIGLNGEFIRVASRSFEDNLTIIDAIKNAVKK
jgi:histidinol-phosphate/aromatic aminotransferase/cobyric acid decarboxylase-like protein